MRLIFFTLLIMNLATAGYIYTTPSIVTEMAISNDSSATRNSGRSVATIPLLSEMISPQGLKTVRVALSADKAVLSSAILVNKALSVDVKANQEGDDGLCVRVGPFPSLAKANYFVEKLAATGVRSEAKNVLASTTVGFWLHLPPLTSKKVLLRKLDELKRQNIDSYAIPDGNLANGISLGMFTEARRANSLKESISRLGYKPQIVEVPREKRELWIFVLPEEAQKISDQAWLNWLSAKELPKKQQILCSDVASA
jgi:hypothetical protein